MSDVPGVPSPSLKSLLKALAIALAIAAVLLVLVVLPAERNIDVTGFGRWIGLTVLSDPKAAAAPQPPAAPTASDAPTAPAATDAPTAPAQPKPDDHATVELPPGKGHEYKFRILAGGKLTYSWTAEGGTPEYDFHGEPKGAPKDVFQSYAEGKATGAKGTLTAPFEGTHGWYWKNSGSKPIKVTLTTSGNYEILGIR
jgi:hypothetical protein